MWWFDHWNDQVTFEEITASKQLSSLYINVLNVYKSNLVLHASWTGMSGYHELMPNQLLVAGSPWCSVTAAACEALSLATNLVISSESGSGLPNCSHCFTSEVGKGTIYMGSWPCTNYIIYNILKNIYRSLGDDQIKYTHYPGVELYLVSHSYSQMGRMEDDSGETILYTVYIWDASYLQKPCNI